MASSPRTASARQLLTALTSSPHASVDWRNTLASLGADWLCAQRRASMTWWMFRQANLSNPLQYDLRRAYYAAAGDAELHRHELAHVLRQLNNRQIQVVGFK